MTSLWLSCLHPWEALAANSLADGPALVVSDDSPVLPTIVVVPLTSQLAALRFPHTLQVEPSPGNGLSVPSVVLLFQLQVVVKRRVLRVVGELDQDHVVQFNSRLRNMLNL